jgi:hypothetical protein
MFASQMPPGDSRRHLFISSSSFGYRDLSLILSYKRSPPNQSKNPFSVISKRALSDHRKGGTGLHRASPPNYRESEWGTVFTDARLIAAIVDRVTFNASIIETGIWSWSAKSSFRPNDDIGTVLIGSHTDGYAGPATPIKWPSGSVK